MLKTKGTLSDGNYRYKMLLDNQVTPHESKNEAIMKNAIESNKRTNIGGTGGTRACMSNHLVCNISGIDITYFNKSAATNAINWLK